MHEVLIPQVQPDVSDFPVDVEEQEITNLQFATRH